MKLSGTIGDIVVTENSQAVEAIEVKFNHPITFNNLPEPIGKNKGSSVSHYYLLLTKIIYLNDEIKIETKIEKFFHQNDCEIIVSRLL